eukprot:gene4011-2865_t
MFYQPKIKANAQREGPKAEGPNLPHAAFFWGSSNIIPVAEKSVIHSFVTIQRRACLLSRCDLTRRFEPFRLRIFSSIARVPSIPAVAASRMIGRGSLRFETRNSRNTKNPPPHQQLWHCEKKSFKR